MRIDIKPMDGYGLLWLSVLRLAMEDAMRTVEEPTVHVHSGLCPKNCDQRNYSDEYRWKAKARGWLASQGDGVGSLRWICSVLNLEPADVVREYERRLTGERPDVRDDPESEGDGPASSEIEDADEDAYDFS